jgi:hypothetical protein
MWQRALIRATTVGVIGGLIILALYTAGKTNATRTAHNAVWSIDVPPSCMVRVLTITKGKSSMDEMGITEFIALKHTVESCGGHLTEEK